MTYKNYHFATSVDEVVTMISQSKKNIILGGTHWLKMGKGSYNTAIDISSLGLDQIEETEDTIIVGGDVSLRALETNPIIGQHAPLLKEALAHIVGVQFRNTARVGASIYSRFGFSDLSTALLALETMVEINGQESIPLEAYQQMPREKHFVTRFTLKKSPMTYVYQSMRQNSTGLPFLTMAITRSNGHGWRLSIGARPRKAMLAQNTSKYLTDGGTDLDKAMEYLVKEAGLSHNVFASEDYRTHLTQVFLKRGVTELWN